MKIETPDTTRKQRAQDAEHEHHAREVEAEHQCEQLGDRRPTGLADDVGDRAECADRGEPQDHHEDLEDELLQVFDAAQDRLTCGAHGLQREADEKRDEQSLQHAARCQRREQGVRDDALDEVQQSAGFVRGFGQLGALACGGVGQVHAAAGVDEVADDQADRERERRHDEEVDERQPADLADGSGFAYRADAQHDRAEDDRRDHHLDQCDEHRAEHADALADLGGEKADRDACEDRDDDGDVEPVRAVAARFIRRFCSRWLAVKDGHCYLQVDESDL